LNLRPSAARPLHPDAGPDQGHGEQEQSDAKHAVMLPEFLENPIGVFAQNRLRRGPDAA
jgi:hypothetical protein